MPTGTYTLQEDLSSGLWIMCRLLRRPSQRAGSPRTTAPASVKVTVVANAETQATIVNSPSTATIKVCKWSASPALQGAQFSFTVNGQTVTATAGKNAANAGCSTALTTQPGTRIKIQESVPANEAVASTTFNGASVTNTAGLVKVTAATGANIVTFENEPVGPPQTGYVEVCKDAGDELRRRHGDAVPVHDHRQDQRRDPGQRPRRPVLRPDPGRGRQRRDRRDADRDTFVSSIFAAPDPNALGPTNLTNGTTTAVVPVSSDTLR